MTVDEVILVLPVLEILGLEKLSQKYFYKNPRTMELLYTEHADSLAENSLGKNGHWSTSFPLFKTVGLINRENKYVYIKHILKAHCFKMKQ